MCLLQYFNWLTEEVESKKLKWQFSNRKKNCSENPKHHYVAFQLPRNSIKSIASLFFLHDRKNFCSCDEHFSPQKFQFRMALSCRFSSLRTPTTISVFLNLNICFAEITGPALDAMRTFVNFWGCFSCAQIRHSYWIRFTLSFWLLSKRWIVVNDTNVTQHGRSTDFNAQETCSSCDMKKL